MLHKIYLVPAEEYHPHTKRGRSSRRRTMEHPHTEWIKLGTKLREAELRRNARTKEIADFMKEILPAATYPQTFTIDIELPTLKEKFRRGSHTDVTAGSVTDTRPSKEIIHETAKREPVREDNDEDDDYDDEVLEDAKRFGRENVGPIAGPYVMP